MTVELLAISLALLVVPVWQLLRAFVRNRSDRTVELKVEHKSYKIEAKDIQPDAIVLVERSGSVEHPRTGEKAPPAPMRELPAPAQPAALPPAASAAAAPDEFSDVVVLYGTDRSRVLGTGGQLQDYGEERGERLNYGTVRVTVPRSHRRGAVERPSLLRLDFREDARRHIVVQEILEANEAAFVERLLEQLRERQTPDVFVFVHGFNVSFKEACRRTAQLAYDLRSFVPVLFSWPSRGTKIDYIADSTAVQFCRPHLRQLIAVLLQRTEIRALHLIGHSMGTQAIASLIGEFVNVDRVKEVVLAAADIDRGVFENQIAPALASGRPHTTIYASATDQALLLSKKANRGYPRIGDCEDGVCVLPGIDTIDVTAVATAKFSLNHSTVFDVRTMVEDLHRLMDNGVPADRRGLEPRVSASGRYWAVAPG